MSDTTDETECYLTTHQIDSLPLLEGPVLEIVVGSPNNTVTWNLPKPLLVKHSDFFKVACKKGFKEGIENEVTLSDIQPNLFRSFVQWLYYGKTRFASGNDSSVCVQADGFAPYFALWILGDRILSLDFKNYVMDAIFQDIYGNAEMMNADNVDFCWSNTTTSSKLHLFVMDLLSAEWQSHS